MELDETTIVDNRVGTRIGAREITVRSSGYGVGAVARGFALRKDGSVGSRPATCHALGWEDLPEDVRRAVRSAWRVEVEQCVSPDIEDYLNG